MYLFAVTFSSFKMSLGLSMATIRNLEYKKDVHQFEITMFRMLLQKFYRLKFF